MHTPINDQTRSGVLKTHSRIVSNSFHVNENEEVMANIDLSGYNLGELKGLQRDIEQAIKARQQQDVQKAREEIMAIAKNAGVSVEDLLAGASKKVSKASGKKVQAQYQNPKDTAQTWTGRGRQPKWIAEGLAKGKALDDFRMK